MSHFQIVLTHRVQYVTSVTSNGVAHEINELSGASVKFHYQSRDRQQLVAYTERADSALCVVFTWQPVINFSLVSSQIEAILSSF